MGNYLSLPILALAAAVQASLMPMLFPFGDGPNLVFLLVLAWSINADLRQTVIWAVVGGVMFDLLSLLPLGTSTLSLLIVVFFVSGIGGQVYRIGLPLLTGLTVGGTLFHEIFIMVMIDVFQASGMLPAAQAGFNPTWVQDFLSIVVPTMLYNLLLILPVYWFIRRIQRRLGIAV